ncbi:sigma-70 family RNA polymerase sigma factor [Streptomyces violaceusniger]|uniref:RNA polymerase sigma factor, sigma-70 family n=1 Tax=Streptomyces violaceusniger (strain Tu 4113) TaxID=653045 RepID=G2PDR5_STRV4|nr:sigma-70 family RNA polymerase sigma factor [Streptomyces violaceusniger]AEM82665.1 RNA polymerase sigma factor, sigma-70 family [Streptomyces violaceusniger Tu 4113]
MDLVKQLGPLLAAEAAAEAYGVGVEPAELEQAVWLRLLERTRDTGPPPHPARWLRRAVRAEVRGARRRARREVPYDPMAGGPLSGPEPHPAEHAVLTAETRRTLRAVVRRLPGRCPALLAAMLSRSDLTYREIAHQLGMSQGSLGPVRSRCLACLRRMLMAEVAAPEPWGKER